MTSMHAVVRLLRVVENRRCADCNAALGEGKNVFAVQSFCTFVCKGCAEIHIQNECGPIDEKLVSALGNNWNDETISAFQKAGSNVRVNKVLEKYAPMQWLKPNSESPLIEKELWIKAKYNKLFLCPLPASQALPFSSSYASSSSSSSSSSTTSLRVPQSPLQQQQQQAHQAKGAPTLPMRIADFFVAIGAGKAEPPQTADGASSQQWPLHCENLYLPPVITSCCPQENMYKDTPLPELLAPFIFPSGMHLSSEDRPPQMYSFVLTDVNRTKLYGVALVVHELLEPEELAELLSNSKTPPPTWPLVFCPRALTVISHYAFFEAFGQFLTQTYHASMSSCPIPIERFVSNFILETPLPPQGILDVRVSFASSSCNISRPPKNQLPMVDFSYRPLFACLSVENILNVFKAICGEYSVCFVSDTVSLLTPVQECFLSFLFPLVFQGVYIPLLPKQMMEILEAPVPLVVGVLRSFFARDRPSSTVLFVDLDRDLLSLGNVPLSDVIRQEPPRSADDTLATIWRFMQHPLPKQAQKLRTKLVEFGSCIYKHPRSISLLLTADLPFPNNEHLTPLASFALNQGEVMARSGSSGASSMTSSSSSTGLKRLIGSSTRHPVACTIANSSGNLPESIYDPKNNCSNGSSSTNWGGGDVFDAREIKAAFLRFFVSLFIDNDALIKGPSLAEGTAASASTSSSRTTSRQTMMQAASSMLHRSSATSSSPQSTLAQASGEKESFLSTILETQLMANFIDERTHHSTQPEIRFFEESILEKKNRSALALTKKTTPFLSDTSEEIKETYSPPPPSLWGIPSGKEYVYSKFPSLADSEYGTLRPLQILIAGPEMGRRVEGKIDASYAIFAKISQSTGGGGGASSNNKTSHGGATALVGAVSGASSDQQKRDLLNLVLARSSERLALLTRGVIVLQSVFRKRIIRKRYIKKRRAAICVQGGFRAYCARKIALANRRLRQMESYINHVECVKSFLRFAMARQKFLRAKRIILWIQCRYRRIVVQRWFKHVVRRFTLFAARVRGFMARKKQAQRRVALFQDLRSTLLYLWKIEATSLFYRSLFWHLVDSPSYLHLALHCDEMRRLFKSLGFYTHGPITRGSACPILVALREVKASPLMKCIVDHKGDSSHAVFASQGLLARPVLARLATARAREAAERDELYKTMKSDLEDKLKEAQFTAFGIELKAKHRKKTLVELLWNNPTSTHLSDVSATAVLSVNLNSKQVAAAKGQYEAQQHHSFLSSFGGGGKKQATPQLNDTLLHNAPDDDVSDVAGEWFKRKKSERLSRASVETVRACLLSLQRKENRHTQEMQKQRELLAHAKTEAARNHHHHHHQLQQQQQQDEYKKKSR